MIKQIEILPLFSKRFEGCINPEVTSIQFCQSETTCYLEISLANNPEDKIICDLDSTTNKTEPEYDFCGLFYSYIYIELNVDTLFELNEEAMFMLLPKELFNEKGLYKMLTKINNKSIK